MFSVLSLDFLFLGSTRSATPKVYSWHWLLSNSNASSLWSTWYLLLPHRTLLDCAWQKMVCHSESPFPVFCTETPAPASLLCFPRWKWLRETSHYYCPQQWSSMAAMGQGESGHPLGSFGRVEVNGGWMTQVCKMNVDTDTQWAYWEGWGNFGHGIVTLVNKNGRFFHENERNPVGWWNSVIFIITEDDLRSVSIIIKETRWQLLELSVSLLFLYPFRTNRPADLLQEEWGLLAGPDWQSRGWWQTQQELLRPSKVGPSLGSQQPKGVVGLNLPAWHFKRALKIPNVKRLTWMCLA